MATTTLQVQLPPFSSASFLNNKSFKNHCCSTYIQPSNSSFKRLQTRAIKEKTEEREAPSSSSSSSSSSSVEEVTKKYGLEAGLWKVGAPFSKLFSLLYFVSILAFLDLNFKCP